MSYPFMTTATKRRRTRAAGALVLASALTACGVSSPPRGELAEHRRILATCTKATPPTSDVEIDGTGSSSSAAITAERLTAVEAIAARTAICSGRLRVSVFSSSSAATVTLFDGALSLHGATANARLKRVRRVVDDAMGKIRTGYGSAVQHLDRGGSDITAQYRRAGEWVAQLGGSFRLHLYLLTDGFQTIGVNLGSKPLSKRDAVALASRVTMPKLPRAVVVVAGLGRVAGKPPRSAVVEGLVVYYDTLCRRVGATRCSSVTDYTTEGS